MLQILTLHQVFVVQWHDHFLLPQDSNTPRIHLNTPSCKTSTPMGAKKNCVGLKLAKTLGSGFALRRVQDRALKVCVHCLRHFNASHSYRGAAVQCILVASQGLWRSGVTSCSFLICIKLNPGNFMCLSKADKIFKIDLCQSKLKTDSVFLILLTLPVLDHPPA